MMSAPYECSYPHNLVKEVIPFIHKNYRTLATKDNRAIAGISVGGMYTVQATNNNPGMFGWIVVWSAGGQDTPEFKAALSKFKASGVKHYYVGAGTNDFALAGSQSLYKIVQDAGLKRPGMTRREDTTISSGGYSWQAIRTLSGHPFRFHALPIG